MNATSPPAPAEQFCVAGEVRLCYQMFGDPTDPTPDPTDPTDPTVLLVIASSGAGESCRPVGRR